MLVFSKQTQLASCLLHVTCSLQLRPYRHLLNKPRLKNTKGIDGDPEHLLLLLSDQVTADGEQRDGVQQARCAAMP
jgi:hypothetical protein